MIARNKELGIKRQKIVIHYNCVGAFDILTDLFPMPSINIQTRKGVALCL